MGNVMEYSFSCSVGTLKTCDNCQERFRHMCNQATCQNFATEQFLIFAVVGKEEFHLHKAIQMGIVQKDFRNWGKSGSRYQSSFPEGFLTSTPHFKIFVSLRGAVARRKWFSFYVRMQNDPTLPETVINPFPFSPVQTGFYFKGKFNFLKKKEVLANVIDPNSTSAGYLKSQKMLPKEVLKQMISKDYSELRKGVRKLKI